MPVALAAASLVIITAVAYAPVLRCGFIWDDDDYVTENPTLRSLGGLKNMWLDRRATPQYYPLVFTSYWIEYQLWGLHPAGYHIVNVLLHAAGVIACWLVLRRLGIPGAWFAAAVFALHPLNVESVAWITERKNVLSGLLYLLSILAYLHFRPLDAEQRQPADPGRCYTLSLAAFLGAVFSKTVTCSMPAAVLLIIWWKRGRLAWRDITPLIPFFVIGIVLGLNTAQLEREHVGASGVEWDLSVVERVLLAGRVAWFYAGKIVWPAELIFLYHRWTIDAGDWRQYLFPAGVLFLLFAFWLLRRRIGRGPLAAALFFGGTLLPALGFFDVYPMRFSWVADHFQYLAGLGLITLLVALLAAALRRVGPAAVRVGAAAGWVVLVLFGVLVWKQIPIYRDVESLWTDTIKRTPTAQIAHYNLGSLRANNDRPAEALEHFREAVRLEPDDFEGHYGLARACAALGRNTEAIAHYRESLRLEPNAGLTHSSLATLLVRMGRWEQAIEHYREALRRRPRRPEWNHNLAQVLARRNRNDEAIEHFRKALRSDPRQHVSRIGLANTLVKIGEYDEAIAECRRVLDAEPGMELSSHASRIMRDARARHDRPETP